MKIYEQVGSVFWLAMAVYVGLESLHLGIGTPRRPGMGFVTFGASVLLGVFSLIVLIRTSLKRTGHGTEQGHTEVVWTRVVFVIVALLIYSQVMSVLGYLISTFLLMTFLFGIVRKVKWHWVFVSSVVTTLATYYLFSKWLNCQFPDGLFGL
jgi:hypothetical protein